MERIRNRESDNFLQTIPLFNKLSRKSLFLISENAGQEIIDVNSIIFEEGDKSDCMYVILKGCVQIFITAEDGRVINLSELEQGDYFGEQALLPGSSGQRSASAVALHETRLLRITRDLFQTCLTKDSFIIDDLTKLGEEQLRFRLAQESALFRTLPLGKDHDQWLQEKSFAEGEVIFREGDIGDCFYLILWGNAKITKSMNDKDEEIASLGPGQYFGELALINSEPRLATITAVSELLTLSLSGSKFMALYESSPELRSHLDNLSDIFTLPEKGFITMHPSILSGLDATTTLYHYVNGVQLAFSKALHKPIFSISNTATKTTQDLKKLVYENKSEGIYRELLMNNNKIVSANCHGLWGDLGYLLETCLKQHSLTRWQSALFEVDGELRLADQSDDLSDQAVICKCTGVTRGILKQGMIDGCESVSELSEKTGAARVCGSCAPLIADITGRPDLHLVDLLEVIPVTQDITSFRFQNKFSHNVASRPSEHIRFEAQINGHWIHRTYTLTSPAHQTDYYEITVKREPQGLLSQWLHDEAKQGDFIRISRPQGGYKFPADPALPYVFFAAGIGITPALSVIRSLEKHQHKTIYIDYSAHSQAGFACKDELINASQTHSGLTVNFRNTGDQQRIGQTDISNILDKYPSAHVYICGPTDYQEFLTTTVSQIGLPHERVHIEDFYPGKDLKEAIPELVGEKPAYVFSIITLLLVLGFLMLPAIAYEQTVTGGWALESLWLDHESRQMTGFTILGLTLGSMFISLRKRINSVTQGRFAWWRLAHVSLAILAMLMLVVHTGLSLGQNYNQVLILTFIGVAMFGSITMLLKLLMVAIPSKKLQQIQVKTNLIHIIVASFVPALLAVHILKSYYFN